MDSYRNGRDEAIGIVMLSKNLKKNSDLIIYQY